MPGHDIIVVGASGGGIEAVSTLAAQLPEDLPATLFVVLHTSPEAPSLLPQILERSGPCGAKSAEDGEVFKSGTIYVAPPDHHLLVKQNYLRVTRGPRENRCRPAIDPLFRSAAVAFRSRVVGVLLTGLLDDGVAGLLAIKRCGGLTVVQQPEDAFYPDMPRAALENVEVDHVCPVARMGDLLNRLVRETPAPPPPIPPEIVLEARMAERAESDSDTEEQLGALAPLGCPECGGPQWELHSDKLQRYRCHVGHAFTARVLFAEQGELLERALWAALRAMEERAKVLTALARKETTRGRLKSAHAFEKRARESRGHLKTIRELLLNANWGENRE